MTVEEDPHDAPPAAWGDLPILPNIGHLSGNRDWLKTVFRQSGDAESAAQRAADDAAEAELTAKLNALLDDVVKDYNASEPRGAHGRWTGGGRGGGPAHAASAAGLTAAEKHAARVAELASSEKIRTYKSGGVTHQNWAHTGADGTVTVAHKESTAKLGEAELAQLSGEDWHAILAATSKKVGFGGSLGEVMHHAVAAALGKSLTVGKQAVKAPEAPKPTGAVSNVELQTRVNEAFSAHNPIELNDAVREAAARGLHGHVSMTGATVITPTPSHPLDLTAVSSHELAYRTRDLLATVGGSDGVAAPARNAILAHLSAIHHEAEQRKIIIADNGTWTDKPPDVLDVPSGPDAKIAQSASPFDQAGMAALIAGGEFAGPLTKKAGTVGINSAYTGEITLADGSTLPVFIKVNKLAAYASNATAAAEVNAIAQLVRTPAAVTRETPVGTAEVQPFVSGMIPQMAYGETSVADKARIKAELTDMATFDALIHNNDRHTDNYGYIQDAQGVWHVMAIDHGLSFMPQYAQIGSTKQRMGVDYVPHGVSPLPFSTRQLDALHRVKAKLSTLHERLAAAGLSAEWIAGFDQRLEHLLLTGTLPYKGEYTA